MFLAANSGISGGETQRHPILLLLGYIVCSSLTVITNKWIIGTAGFAMILTAIHLAVATILTQTLKYTTSLISSPKIPKTWSFYLMIILPLGSLHTSTLFCNNLAFFTLSVSFISMLKILAPILALIFAWGAGLAKLTISKLVNISLIALGVVLSSLGEFDFVWEGFIFQILGIVAGSAYLVLLQWYLTSFQDNTRKHSQPADIADDETDLASSSGSSEHEIDNNGNVGAVSGYHSDGDGWSGLPTNCQGASETSLDDDVGNRDNGGALKASPLGLLYYYAPIWAVLNGLMALIFEAPEFDWKDLNHIGVGMLALSGVLVSLASMMSFSLIGKTSALTMSITDILKSLTLVEVSIIIWSTPITGLQAFGYTISLAGMAYLALQADTEAPFAVLLKGLRRCVGRSKE